MKRGILLSFLALVTGPVLLILAACDMSLDTMTGDKRTNAAAPPAAAPAAVPKVVPENKDLFFKETARSLGQPFLSYWQEHGGVAVFGYPISDSLAEIATENGEQYTAKYFERARFELHPSTGNKVILGTLGSILHRSERPAAPLPEARYFKETGHNLSGSFLTFWSQHGGLEIFGYPITEVRTEKNLTNDKEYKVQYFERSKFELHPEFAGTPSEVQLGLLGTQMFQQTYGR